MSEIPKSDIFAGSSLVLMAIRAMIADDADEVRRFY